ncbi:MAG: Binding-protein-dependent transport systems inner membrane component, partial [Petrotoga mobilis]
MNYSKFVKTLWTLIVYILLAGSAIVMLLPFAWMVMTSLKTSSEINLWPPTWTTKNFQNEWDLNLKLTPSKPSPRTGLGLSEFRILSTQESYNPYKLVYEIDGDFVSRGRVQLSLNKIDYTHKT